MKHTEQPAAIYDLASAASVLGKYNARSLDAESRDAVEHEHEGVVQLLRRMKDKPILPHINAVICQEADAFLARIRTILSHAGKQKTAHPILMAETQTLLDRAADNMGTLPRGSGEQWLVKGCEIDAMMGLSVCEESARQVLDAEMAKWSRYEKPSVPSLLAEHISANEIRGIASVVRRQLLGGNGQDEPLLFLENEPQQYHLFWNQLGN